MTTDQQLDAIVTLPAGWNSYGAAAPRPEIVAAARILLRRLGDVPTPFINPTPNGGVQFEWEIDGRYFEIEVESATEASFFYSDPGQRNETEGRFDVADNLVEVIKYINL